MIIDVFSTTHCLRPSLPTMSSLTCRNRNLATRIITVPYTVNSVFSSENMTTSLLEKWASPGVVAFGAVAFGVDDRAAFVACASDEGIKMLTAYSIGVPFRRSSLGL